MTAFDGNELDSTREPAEDPDDLTGYTADGEDSDPDDDEPESEPGANYPTLYVDGDPVHELTNGHNFEDLTELERVQVEFDAAANGMQSEADEAAPLGWVNSAAITLDREEDAVHVSISVGDPRGAFVFTIRRIPADSPNEAIAGRLLMHLPTPSDGMLHMPLTLDHEGTYLIGN